MISQSLLRTAFLVVVGISFVSGCTSRYAHIKHYYAESRVSQCRKLDDFHSDSENETGSQIAEWLKAIDAGLNNKSYVPTDFDKENLNRAKDKAVNIGGDTVLLISDDEFEIYDCGRKPRKTK